jgi:hypothetical protein
MPAPGRIAVLLGLLPGLLTGLAACDAGRATETQIRARQQAIDPPQLWLVQVGGERRAGTASVFVCADSSLREAFVRARAEVNGAPCLDTTPPLARGNAWSLRCEAKGEAYAVSTTTLGDLTQDFRLDFALTPIEHIPGVETVRQTERFRRMGACPDGWRIGDQARPGRKPRKVHPARA